MRKLSLKSKTWIYVGAFTAVLLGISLSLLAVVYYWISINSIKRNLVNATKEIVDKQMIWESEEIRFKRDEYDRTISAYLRDINMSAVFLDSKLTAFAGYGIYQVWKEENILDTKINETTIKRVWERGEPIFEENHFGEKEEYYTMTTPILLSGEKVGVIQLAFMSSIFGQIKDIGLYVLGIVMLLGILLSWPLSHILVDSIFEPLEKVIEAMERARVTNLNVPLEDRDGSEEVSLMVKAYNNMLKRISEGLERQKTFISNASHELKTPLSRTISTVELAILDIEEENQKEAIRKLNTAKEEMMGFSQIIEEMLILSKIDAGLVRPEMKKVFLSNVVERALALNEKEIIKKRLKIINGVDKKEVISDPVLLPMILSNLISNAAKYSFEDGKVEIKTKIKGEKLELIIRDEGVGVKKEEMKRVFERFYRSSSVVAKYNGSGIGMSLVKQISEILKLRIDFDKEIAKGTEVVISGWIMAE